MNIWKLVLSLTFQQCDGDHGEDLRPPRGWHHVEAAGGRTTMSQRPYHNLWQSFKGLAKTLSQCNCNPSLVITTTKNFCCRDLHHYRTSNRVSVCPPFCFRLLLFVTSVPRGHRRGGDRGGHCPSVARGRSCGGTARKGLFCLLGNDNFRSHDSCLGKESQS